MTYHCFFEQSGTFKNEFIKLGYNAYDYDLLNDFSETDYIIDLFNEINNCFNGDNSIFDSFTDNDFIIAFFPCVRFEEQIILQFKGVAYQQKNYDLQKKLLYDIKLHNELHDLYVLLCKFCYICCIKNIKLCIENPYGFSNYLKRYFCIEPFFIDFDRRINGDFYKKPTQYFFINFIPYDNLVFETVYNNKTYNITTRKKENNINRKVLRSMICPEYANRFIRQHIIDNPASK